MRIFRTLLVLTGIAVFLPSPPEVPPDVPTAVAGNGFTAQQGEGLITTATMAIADIASFCSRQPEVCQTAGFVAGKLEAKAKYSVKLIYEWANEASGLEQGLPAPDQAEAVDPITTSSAKTNLALAPESQSTLRLDDLIPEWRGPSPQKKKG